jgi:hypothetical protein
VDPIVHLAGSTPAADRVAEAHSFEVRVIRAAVAVVIGDRIEAANKKG